jgi:hypothetical protein
MILSLVWEGAMRSIRYGYLVLAVGCLALAVFDHNYREFAVTGGLFIVAEAILQRWDGTARS